MQQSMTNTIGVIRGTFLTERQGAYPAAFRIHPKDWYKLLSEVSACSSNLASDMRFMNMVPLVDPKWKRGFPICVDTKGASEAIEAGARQAV